MASTLNLARFFKYEGGHVTYQSGLEAYQKYIGEVSFAIRLFLKEIMRYDFNMRSCLKSLEILYCS